MQSATAAVALPHAYPFRFVDRTGPDRVRFELTANMRWLGGSAAWPSAFCAEIVAQAAGLLLARPEASGAERWLAGIERLELSRELFAGESIEVIVRTEARLGRVVKVAGELFSDSEKVAEATLLLA